jgi:DNA-binding transcriptional regulator GbsR (MarR family)
MDTSIEFMEESEKISREMVESTGKVFEKFGLTPMQGRIVAYFIISDSPEKTFEDLVQYFKASKSSVSNSLNFLLSNKVIDYKTFASDRKRYFFITDSFFRVYFEKVLENVNELKEHAFKAVSMRSPHHPEASAVILKWIENANLYQESVGKVMAQLKKESA